MTWTDAEISKVARRTKIIQNEDHGDQQDEIYRDVYKEFPMTEETKNQSTLWNSKAPHQEGPVKNTEA